jgi:hypothetical protein
VKRLSKEKAQPLAHWGALSQAREALGKAL